MGALNEKEEKNDGMPKPGGGDMYEITENRDEIIHKLVVAYKESEYREKALNFSVPSEDDGRKIFATIAKDFYITPLYNQIMVVLVRSFLHKFREPIALMTQAFNALVIPLLFGSVYWQIDLTQESAFDRIAGLSLLILMLSFFTFDVIMVCFLFCFCFVCHLCVLLCYVIRILCFCFVLCLCSYFL